MSRHNIRLYGVWMTVLVMLAACKSYRAKEAALPDTPNRGLIHVSCDESFRPVIDEQAKVYESNHPGTTIDVQYKPEADCLQDLLNDSIRVVMATRWYTQQEKQLVRDSLHVGLYGMVLARDAVALVVNPESDLDSLTIPELQQILQGKFKENLIPVFDGVKATSTVRFIIDSVLKGGALSPSSVAARTSAGVIDYIAEHKEAIGFIGYSWIGDKDDTLEQQFLQKVKILRLRSTYAEEAYYKPSPWSISNGAYPLVRDLVYILKERHAGLGNGFVDFMSGQRGQLIFRRSYLVPGQLDFSIRAAQLRKD